MRTRRWSDLPASKRRVILTFGVFEGLLKVAALFDLRRRPASEVRGSKRLWSLAIAFVNSGGLVPVAYFVRGRRRPK